MIQGRIIAAETTGAVLGTANVLLMRELIDSPVALAYLKAKAAGQSPSPPFLMKSLKGFGSPSVLIGIAEGAITEILGILGATKNTPFVSPAVNSALLTFGGSTLAAAIIGGIFPQQNWASAVAVDPGNPLGAGSRINRGQMIVNSTPPTASEATAAALL